MKPPDRPLIRIRLEGADLRAAWEHHAAEFVAWARAPDHDSYPQFHRELFLPLVPPPGRRTLDLGCGEGRVSRDLKEMGHRVVGVDVSATMLTAARVTDPSIDTCLADAARLPFADRSFDCVIAFMSLQDVDEMATAIEEAARVLETGGRLCLAIVHPLNSAGRFADDEPDSPFTIEGSYLKSSHYEDNVARGGLEMTFVSAHRPVSAYAQALADSGLLIERLREPPVPKHAMTRPPSSRWSRVPLFLHLRALKP
jgi:SAM-dependent methyltransferase